MSKNKKKQLNKTDSEKIWDSENSKAQPRNDKRNIALTNGTQQRINKRHATAQRQTARNSALTNGTQQRNDGCVSWLRVSLRARKKGEFIAWADVHSLLYIYWRIPPVKGRTVVPATGASAAEPRPHARLVFGDFAPIKSTDLVRATSQPNW